MVAGEGPVPQAAIPYLPPGLRAELWAELRAEPWAEPRAEPWAGRSPPAGFIPCATGGENTALCPPAPRCWVSCCSRTDAQTPPERGTVLLSSLPARAAAQVQRSAPRVPTCPGLSTTGRALGVGAGWDHRALLGWSTSWSSSTTRTVLGVRGRSHPQTHPDGDGDVVPMWQLMPSPRSSGAEDPGLGSTRTE